MCSGDDPLLGRALLGCGCCRDGSGATILGRVGVVLAVEVLEGVEPLLGVGIGFKDLGASLDTLHGVRVSIATR